jgi:hypothetical protein
MNDYDCYIEFQPKNDESLLRIKHLFEIIKSAKESDEQAKLESTINDFSESEKSYFWNPTPKELAQWNAEYFATPVSKRDLPEMLMPQWTLDSMLEAFWNCEYQLVSVIEENNAHYLMFIPLSFPYGGTESLVVFTECFGHTVIGIEDDFGYRKHVPQTEFWQPQK